MCRKCFDSHGPSREKYYQPRKHILRSGYRYNWNFNSSFSRLLEEGTTSKEGDGGVEARPALTVVVLMLSSCQGCLCMWWVHQPQGRWKMKDVKLKLFDILTRSACHMSLDTWQLDHVDWGEFVFELLSIVLWYVGTSWYLSSIFWATMGWELVQRIALRTMSSAAFLVCWDIELMD